MTNPKKERPRISAFGIDRVALSKLTEFERKKFLRELRPTRHEYFKLKSQMQEQDPFYFEGKPVRLSRKARQQLEAGLKKREKKSPAKKLLMETFFFAWLGARPSNETEQ